VPSADTGEEENVESSPVSDVGASSVDSSLSQSSTFLPPRLKIALVALLAFSARTLPLASEDTEDKEEVMAASSMITLNVIVVFRKASQ
jgi:hypothetical protein